MDPVPMTLVEISRVTAPRPAPAMALRSGSGTHSRSLSYHAHDSAVLFHGEPVEPP
jgi:hypothetical protein